MPARWVPPHLGFLPGHNKEGARSSRVKDEAQGSASKRPGLIKAISPRDNGRRDAVMVKRTMQLGEVPYCPACQGHDCWARLRWVSSSSALLLLAPGTWHSPCLSSALARWAATLQITFWGLRHSPRSHTKAPLLHKRSLREPGASLPLLAGSRRQCWEQEQCSVAKAGPREQLARGWGAETMPPGRAGVQEESGISHVGIHRSLLNCVCSQQATVGQPGCFLLRSREEAHPAAAASCTNSSCCPQPWGARWAEGHSLAPPPSHSPRVWPPPPSHEPTARLPGRCCVSLAGPSA